MCCPGVSERGVEIWLPSALWGDPLGLLGPVGQWADEPCGLPGLEGVRSASQGGGLAVEQAAEWLHERLADRLLQPPVSVGGDASPTAEASLAAAALFISVSAGGDASPSALAPPAAAAVSTLVSVGGDASPTAEAPPAAAAMSTYVSVGGDASPSV